ncbi:MAG: hypothetical protein BAJALOKI2v1_170018 [Promethearchaeota archaeon]|nr:MAG: hypothetical protein BAJALOKI2v1_170018 [Candidatus Lokiarchaeota archaeon]
MLTTWKRIFEEKESMTKIRICPKCKEAKLKPAMNVSGWLAPDMYECRNCNYVGSFYLVIDPEELKESEIEDISDSGNDESE